MWFTIVNICRKQTIWDATVFKEQKTYKYISEMIQELIQAWKNTSLLVKHLTPVAVGHPKHIQSTIGHTGNMYILY